jgi:hypothetical protein
MALKELPGKAMMAVWEDERERAIANVKRTDLGRWFRRAWYRAGGRRRRGWAAWAIPQGAKGAIDRTAKLWHDSTSSSPRLAPA